MKKILSISLLLLGTWVFTACSDDKETTSYQHTEQTFKNLVGGDYDPLHWWKTAIQLKVTVKTDFPATVVAYSTNGETGVFYDSKHVSQDSTQEQPERHYPNTQPDWQSGTIRQH